MVDGRQARYLRDPDVMTYAQWWNLLGNPAAVVPVGRSPEGLPIGVQVWAGLTKMRWCWLWRLK